MLIAFSVKNKLGFLDGSIEKPDGSDLVLLNSWIHNNNLVISWILNSVSKKISASIIFSESAAEIWLDLKDRFSQSNGPRIFQLRREFVNLAQDQHSVSVYFTKLKSLWEELSNFRPVCSCGKCTCGGVKALYNHCQMDYIMSFLMGLNESFAQVRGQILLMDPLSAINKVFSFISQEERHRKVSSQSISTGDLSHSMAFAAKNDSFSKPSNGSPSSSAAGNKNQRKDRPFCTHCNYHGHTIDKCYKIHGYPPGFRQRQRTQSPATQPGMVNQVSNHVVPEGRDSQNGSTGNLLQNLTSV
ncbi:uncharacterized protein LOC112094030 [Morus notabilis]|uniref:uncharacterized protein LOC112094030 n=1 Tax=Morus notabilis TaxID=981085 RepID=UPI000CED545F|nr:uncharacterized protein LOC112094030 [Morus notabilis]